MPRCILGGQIISARQSQGEEDPFVAGIARRNRCLEALALTSLVLILLGCLGLFFGSEAFVHGPKMALNLGISTHVVGVTTVAFGTSVPEIAASLTAAIRGNGPEHSLAPTS